MMTIREQKESVMRSIEMNENMISTLKDDVKADKARLKKLDKIEKELTSIFGEQKDNVNPFYVEEVPDQMSIEDVTENVG